MTGLRNISLSVVVEFKNHFSPDVGTVLDELRSVQGISVPIS